MQYGPKIVINGLILNLDAADKTSYIGSGTNWVDLSGSGNSGVLTNTPTFNNTNGGNFTFNGSNQYADCGNKTILQTVQGSIFAWVKSTTNDSTYRAIIVKQYNYGIYIRNSYLIAYDWGNNVERASSTSIIDGNWKHVGMTFTTTTGTPSNNAILYVNAVPILTTTLKWGANNDQNLFFAYGNFTGQYLNGSMANGYVYNRALNAAEVLQNFNATRGRFAV